jgi:hypothetical protein
MYPGPENWGLFGGSQFATQMEDPVGLELGEGRVEATQAAAPIPGVVRWSDRVYHNERRKAMEERVRKDKEEEERKKARGIRN